MATFYAQVGFDPTRGGNVDHHRFANVRVQVVCYETPRSIWVGADDAVDVFKKVFFGSSLANQRRKNLSGRDVQVPEQPQCSMTNILVLPLRKHAMAWKQIGGDSFQSLDTGLLVDRDRMSSLRMIKLKGTAVRIADFEDLGIPSFGIIDLGEQPILTSMRLNIGAILKKTTLQCVKCLARFPV